MLSVCASYSLPLVLVDGSKTSNLLLYTYLQLFWDASRMDIPRNCNFEGEFAHLSQRLSTFKVLRKFVPTDFCDVFFCLRWHTRSLTTRDVRAFRNYDDDGHHQRAK